MIYKKWISIILLHIVFLLTGCSQKKDINGIYVHFSGDQHYYTMTISDNSNGQYTILLEGVPIDQIKNIPWTMECTTSLSNLSMKCENFTLSFDKNYEKARVMYTTDINQVFISNKIDIEEETIHYETKN